MTDIAELERRMQPGAWDAPGFLRPGTSLLAVLADDAAAVGRLSLDAVSIGARLGAMLEAGATSEIGRPASVDGHFVEILRERGFVTCPWAPEEFESCPAGQGGHPTANRFVVTDAFGRRLAGFVLSAHLIRDHEFFGGPDTRYRLEPEAVASVLGLTNPA